MPVSINYKRHGSDSALHQTESVREAIEWMQTQSPNDFEYISLTDSKGNQVIGYGNIIDVYEFHSDLWQGDEGCIHPTVSSGIGGGCHCNTCPAWFCY